MQKIWHMSVKVGAVVFYPLWVIVSVLFWSPWVIYARQDQFSGLARIILILLVICYVGFINAGQITFPLYRRRAGAGFLMLISVVFLYIYPDIISRMVNISLACLLALSITVYYLRQKSRFAIQLFNRRYINTVMWRLYFWGKDLNPILRNH